MSIKALRDKPGAGTIQRTSPTKLLNKIKKIKKDVTLIQDGPTSFRLLLTTPIHATAIAAYLDRSREYNLLKIVPGSPNIPNSPSKIFYIQRLRVVDKRKTKHYKTKNNTNNTNI